MIPGLWHIVVKAADGRPEGVRSSNRTAEGGRLVYCKIAKGKNEYL